MGRFVYALEYSFIDCLTPDKPRNDDKSQTRARSHAAKVSFRNRHMTGGLTKVLLKGNSDPFQALPILVTPRIAAAINFRKSYYVPACSYSCYPSWSVLKGNQQTTDVVIHRDCAQLSNTDTAYAFILYLVSIQMRLSSKDDGWRNESLKLKADTLKALRKNIVSDLQQEAASTILWLFAEAVMSANLKEALIHGRAFRDIWSSIQSNGGQVAAADLSTAFWLDSHLSIMFMRRAILDPQLFPKNAGICANILAMMRATNYSYNSSLPSFLQESITRFRLSHSIWNSSVAPFAHCDTREVVQQLVFCSHVRKSQLMNFYLDNSFSIIGSLTLAILLLELTKGCDPAFGGRRLLPSTQTIMKQLYASMRDRIQPGHAELWCLYVGAYVEQKESPDANNTWFKRMFASLTSMMQLTKAQVYDILEGFLNMDSIECRKNSVECRKDSWLEDILCAPSRVTNQPQVLQFHSWVQIGSN